MHPSVLALLVCAATIGDASMYGRSSESSLVGCYMWSEYSRVLPYSAMESSLMTRTICSDSCFQRSMKYFGVAAGTKCFCGDSMYGSVKLSTMDCDKSCSGDGAEMCGSDMAMNVLETSAYSGGAESNPVKFGENVVGCYVPSDYSQVLSHRLFESNDMTQASCEKQCASKAMQLFGLRAGRICYCDKALGAGSQTTRRGNCAWRCSGNLREPCGSEHSILVFRVSRTLYGDLIQVVPPEPLSKSSNTLWSFNGCLHTRLGDTLMAVYDGLSDKMSHEHCYKRCHTKAAPYFGVMDGNMCLCSYSLRNPRPAPMKLCQTLPCTGNAKEYCGHAEAIAVFKIKAKLQGRILPFVSCVQGSTYEDATCERAYDGNVNQAFRMGSCSHSGASMSWWTGELVRRALIIEVRIYNRADCCRERLNDFIINADRIVCATHKSYRTFSVKTFPCQAFGQQVQIISRLPYLTLCEVQVFVGQ